MRIDGVITYQCIDCKTKFGIIVKQKEREVLCPLCQCYAKEIGFGTMDWEDDENK